ncbi:MAG: hypothetical protein JXA77_11330 [Bacteroidales bacterium]|nr:hypothetical protein [Bacteroidales bacterium]
MAKDKTVEAKYNEERIRRTYIRKEKRRRKYADSLWNYGRPSESTCPNCGGTMHWCSTCQMWSRSCCVEYGTCQCS